MFSPKKIEDLYKSLSSLYKNPTRGLAEIAAVNVDEALIELQHELLQRFLEGTSELKKANPALYFKTLALLYEIDDYRGAESKVQSLIADEGDALLNEIDRELKGHRPFLAPARGYFGSPPQVKETFTSPYSRSYWKARVICCVAMVESRRREGHNRKLDSAKSLAKLTQNLELLESFVVDRLHLREQKLDAWTTLAFVRAAQARIARQGQEYRLAEQKLLTAIQCLDGRAEEIRAQAQRELSSRQLDTKIQPKNGSKASTKVIEELQDDMVSIRRKQTLISFFNVALVALQRGFLRTANRACQSARLQFRLHGHYYHALFNDLIILSIKRARTSRNDIEKFQKLKTELEDEIISHVKPDTNPGTKGNRKLYVYALRELALLQSYCGEVGPMLQTLDVMEKSARSLGEQWKSRVYHQRARASWLQGLKQNDAAHFQQGLDHSNTAFKAASDANKKIDDYKSVTTLVDALKHSKRTNMIETVESLITYGSIQASARNFDEAIKTAEAILEYCDEENPRLLAMGYLVRAEAYVETDRILEAKQDVAAARILQRRIDHKYVADRMRAIEKRWLKQADYIPLEDLKDDPQIWKKATERLRGWVIQNHSTKGSTTGIHKSLRMGKPNVIKYLQAVKQDQTDPYHHLGEILSKFENIREGKRTAKNKKLATKQADDEDAES